MVALRADESLQRDSDQPKVCATYCCLVCCVSLVIASSVFDKSIFWRATLMGGSNPFGRLSEGGLALHIRWIKC